MNIYVSRKPIIDEDPDTRARAAGVNERADAMQAAGYLSEAERRQCVTLYDLRKAVERAEKRHDLDEWQSDTTRTQREAL